MDFELIEPLTNYLVSKKGVEIISRSVSQRRGGVKFAVDLLVNTQSIVLRCGGRLNTERLLAGDVSMATDNSEAHKLFEVFSKVIRQYFKKIKSYYVGPDAARLLDEGCRLCPTEKSTPEYDLSR